MSLSILVKSTAKLQFIPKDSAIEIPLDASISENHNYSSSVTQFPVEDGSSISDNIINSPVTLEINGFVSNNPVILFTQNISNLIDDTTGGDRVKTAFESLISLRDSKESFTVVTGLKTYTNMVFTELRFPRDRGTGSTNLRFTAQLINIKYVESRTVSVTRSVAKTPASLSDQATSTQDIGKQVTKQDVGESSSLLYDTLKGIGLF